jgi:hypothetical protein
MGAHVSHRRKEDQERWEDSIEVFLFCVVNLKGDTRCMGVSPFFSDARCA